MTANEEEKRCSGHCCKGFHLPYWYNEIMKMERGPNITNNQFHKDTRIIQAMLIPMYWECTGVDDEMRRYSCKHQLSNGDCGIYEERPYLCRDYPKRRCEWPQCTKRPQPPVEYLGELTKKDVSINV
jgi:Fe-S-cluster containining protein